MAKPLAPFALLTCLLFCSVPSLLVCTPLTQASAQASRTDFFVAPNGRDANRGTKALPFATLRRARDAVRRLSRSGGLLQGGVTVWLRGGAYPLASTLKLTERDSGTADAPVVYRGYPGETARVMGGPIVPASAFGPVTDASVSQRLDASARGKVLEADLKALGVTDLGPPWPATFLGYAGWPELFFGGRPMALARWPNEGLARVAKVVEQGSVPRYGDTSNRPGKFAYDGGRPARWLHADDAYLNGYWCYKWYAQCIRVAAIDPDAKTITFAAPALYGVGGPSGGEYYALNLLEELDSPGEYYLDRSSGMLYFWPPKPLGGAQVALSTLQAPMVTLTNASHVTIRDLIFEVSRGMAATINGGSDNLIAACTIRNIATEAISVSGGERNGVAACEMYNMGGGGISLNGGDRNTLTPCGNYADNNHIHDYARLFRTHHDAINLNGVGCRASHNSIHDAPHHAMDFGGNDHVVEFNEVYRVCMETDDAGGIYTGRNWSVQGNVIH